ncbi:MULTISPECIES: hypothetical protein [Anoxybacillaceae]|uniref:hypothetical protein n=1 Tax=Anoxybacillaceae TaxID=3120669 RepID=UPI0018670351|nr:MULTISPECIES: hypothetical protein [Bacillaceae]MBE2907581.1 hypothetical protein [Anoxybacillus flavithermus]MBE2911292.1 hypothetical protein [Anoxybacillus flavithermus]MBE2916693.1 hypothetical protein [Anoxybacillus flavithermus]MBE2929252.1 hypothetical protein [Anoxybacillus flavithermus]MBE2956312.1 hypothetical protein [Anoxybacillus flavithermus]
MSISSLILLLLVMSIVLFVYGVVQKSKAAKRIAFGLFVALVGLAGFVVFLIGYM